jgi:hypothetical protein
MVATEPSSSIFSEVNSSSNSTRLWAKRGWERSTSEYCLNSLYSYVFFELRLILAAFTMAFGTVLKIDSTQSSHRKCYFARNESKYNDMKQTP